MFIIIKCGYDSFFIFGLFIESKVKTAFFRYVSMIHSTLESEDFIKLTRSIVRISSNERTDWTRKSRSRVDLTEEDTIPLLNNDIGSMENNNDIEILNSEPPAFPNLRNENTLNLESLNSDTEYRQNLTRIFVNLDQYARSILNSYSSE